MTAGSLRGWALQLWLYTSMVSMFSMLLWQQSTGAGHNIYDLMISAPALFVLFPLMLYRGWLSRSNLVLTLPLILYVLYAVLSTAWAESPDVSSTVRAALQVLGLYVLFLYLRISGATLLLRNALFFACVAVALLCFWHLVVMYVISGKPWSYTLYQGISSAELSHYGVKAVNAMHATMMVAPQAALLLGLVAGSKNRAYHYVGVFALSIFCLFLIALERRTGQLAIIVAIATCAVVYRKRPWYWLLGVALIGGLIVFWVAPEFVLSRGLSWRPAIWMSTIHSILEAPFFGHGVTNVLTPVAVSSVNGGEQLFDHPHNVVLSVLFYTGVIGLSFWCLIWMPSMRQTLFTGSLWKHESYMVVALVVGLTVLMFDGGNALSPFHFDWFAFWVPAMLLLSSGVVGEESPEQKSSIQNKSL